MLNSLNSLFGRKGNSGGSGGVDGARQRTSYGLEGQLGSSSDTQSYPPQRMSARTAQGNISPARIKHSIARIKSMMNRINPELLDTLSYSASTRAMSDLQGALRDYILPRDVLEAYGCHNGQDTFSVSRNGSNEEHEGNTGFIYGLWWMSIEEALEEYEFWRRLDISTPPSPVATKKMNGGLSDKKGKGRQHTHTARAPSTDAFLFGSEMDPRTVRGRMRSCPRKYVREEYSHPSWFPILKDGYGNYIGVDLDPPPYTPQKSSEDTPQILPGRGQVIAFGREIDTKTVLWNGWADQSEHDANIGGGWARFVSSFADDLSASSSLGSTDPLYGTSHSYSINREDEDENAYRSSSGGRQESSSFSRSAAGLEWMDSSPVYSGLGTIEALVERSKRQWTSAGLYGKESEGIDDSEGFGNASFETSRSGTSGRSGKPSPLMLPGWIDNDDRALPSPSYRSSQELNAPLRNSSDTRSSTASSRAPESAFVHLAPSPSDLKFDEIAVQSGNPGIPPISPEPSLILSPPSPKDNKSTFPSFPSSSPTSSATNPNSPQYSPTPAGRRSLPISSLSSPTSGDGLQSPSRFSPAQAARNAERQRTLSGLSISSTESGLVARSRDGAQKKRPPPPAAPLGLPTLEFGNGIWEFGDTSLDEEDTNKVNFDNVLGKR